MLRREECFSDGQVNQQKGCVLIHSFHAVRQQPGQVPLDQLIS